MAILGSLDPVGIFLKSFLRKGVDILVATPGRLLDLLNQRMLSLSDVEIFVLDEADRMLDMGFINDIRRVIEQLPARRNHVFNQQH